MRAVVSYDDLPHEPAALDASRPDDARKRRKRATEGPTRYVGPHWDAPPDAAHGAHAASSGAPAWAAGAVVDPASAEPAADLYADDRNDALDSDSDAMVASPTPADAFPFFTDVHVPEDEAVEPADVWDDRFLREVWDAAADEYRAFHARRADALDRGWFGSVRKAPGADAAEVPPDATPGWTAAQRIVAATPNSVGGAEPIRDDAPPAPLDPPEHLQHLVMAWYYAGYYTARYEQSLR